MDQEAKLRALKRLAMLESSGGKFRQHPVVESGIQQGTRAVSSYGLMPNTLFELAQKDRHFQHTPAGQQILQTGGDPEQINQVTSDPKQDDVAAQALWDYNQKRLGKYIPPEKLEEAGVYAHRRGVSGAINAYTQGKSLQDDPYVKQYLEKDDEL